MASKAMYENLARECWLNAANAVRESDKKKFEEQAKKYEQKARDAS